MSLRRSLLKFRILVYALFDEYAFERGKMKLCRKFVEAYAQLAGQQFACAVDIVAQYIAD